MNRTKRVLALLLALVMLFALSGCGGLEARLVRAANKLSKLESLRMDMKLDSTMSLSLFGQATALDLGMDGRADLMMKPLRVYMETDTTAMGQSVRLRSYLQENDTTYDLLVSADGKNWERRTLSRGEGSEKLQPMDQLKVLLDLAKSFEETEKETIRGESASVYSGTIPESYVRGLLEASGILKTLGESLDVDLSGLELSQVGSVPVTLALGDKSGLPLRITLDMTGALRSVMDTVLQEALRQYGMEDLDLKKWGVSATVEQVILTAEFYDFDQVKELAVPPEALEAA